MKIRHFLGKSSDDGVINPVDIRVCSFIVLQWSGRAGRQKVVKR
jgi:hypothetical protein